MDCNTTVLVVGAGPTGLVLAHELGRRGLRCRVIDRGAAPLDTSRAVLLTPRTLEALALMGLADEFCAAGRRIGRGTIRAGGFEARMRFDALPTAFPFLLSVPQQMAEAILRRALARQGVEVERNTRLVDLAPDPRGVLAQIACGTRSEALRARFVAGCDGAHSTVRHLLDFGLDLGPAEPETALIADLSLDGPASPDSLELRARDGRWTALIPLQDGLWRLVAEDAGRDPAERGRRRVGDADAAPDAAAIQAALEAGFGPRLRLGRLHWSAMLRTDRRAVRRLRQGPVFLAGEAARVCGPALGQGMNAGIQDAFNLGWKLALVSQGGAGPELLDSYEAERLPAQMAAQAELDRLVLARDARAPGLDHGLGRVLRRLWRRPSDAPATAAGDRLAGLLAGIPEEPADQAATLGARAPDLPCQRFGDRAPGRVHGLLGGGHALLLVAGEAEDRELAERIVQIWRAAPPTRWAGSVAWVKPGQGFGRRPAAYVVRPDGYIALGCALRDAPARVAALLATGPVRLAA